ncbi:hypothetical protein NJF44_14385 [Pseudomonas guariconensis]|uniref:hypothetical protein n=1 Tax=Pseudomonas TaxID=286 RepID=UPI001CE3D2B3|nr:MULTISPECIES: hypothetical protein [Pseudomonas]MCO7640246.1 hypothetical protein [Pseudomonas sp. S 311-6]MCO7515976.1 hypothetical protein [Pseudomonas putida]MCO7565562.1 hypothetical protein [Pseudomonas mosselii]MCO7593242.1 hypothetical protein [Pseudomonas guariconensis]MCO7606425.1 hypothetical protein [Pseudomonas guariconensis]
MLLNSTYFPLVWMKIGGAGIDTGDEGFAAFEALLAREEPFVLLDAENADRQAHEHSHEERKRLSLWMKRHKAALRAFVRGQVLVEPDAEKQKAARSFASTFEAFWGYPLLVVNTEEEAFKVADQLLAK